MAGDDARGERFLGVAQRRAVLGAPAAARGGVQLVASPRRVVAAAVRDVQHDDALSAGDLADSVSAATAGCSASSSASTPSSRRSLPAAGESTTHRRQTVPGRLSGAVGPHPTNAAGIVGLAAAARGGLYARFGRLSMHRPATLVAPCRDVSSPITRRCSRSLSSATLTTSSSPCGRYDSISSRTSLRSTSAGSASASTVRWISGQHPCRLRQWTRLFPAGPRPSAAVPAGVSLGGRPAQRAPATSLTPSAAACRLTPQPTSRPRSSSCRPRSVALVSSTSIGS